MSRFNECSAKVYLEWDVYNWARALETLEEYLIDGNQGLTLEIGGRHGGLSLLLAHHDWKVHCTDLNGHSEKAKSLHASQSGSQEIQYRTLDILNPDCAERYDLIVFKSVMGGVSAGSDEARNRMIEKHPCNPLTRRQASLH